MPSLKSLDLTRTPASKSLDWSAQLKFNLSESSSTIRNRQNTSTIELSDACRGALENSLVFLNLSRNSLRCHDYDITGVASQEGYSTWIMYSVKQKNRCVNCDTYRCDFQNIIMPMNDLLSVDLSHNDVHSVNVAVQEVLRRVVNRNIARKTGASGVFLAGNPIAAISLVGKRSSFVEAWFQSLAEGSIPVRYLRLLTIAGPMEGTWKWIKNSVLRQSIEKISLRSVEVLSSFEGFGRMPELAELYFDSMPDDNSGKFGVNLRWLRKGLLPKLKHLLMGTGARSIVSRDFMDGCNQSGLEGKIAAMLSYKPSFLVDFMEFHTNRSSSPGNSDCWCQCDPTKCRCVQRHFVADL